MASFEVRFEVDESWGNFADAVRKAGRNLQKESAVVLNEVAKDERREMNKDLRQHLRVTAKAINKVLIIKQKARPNFLVASVQFKPSKRIPLKDFGARQGKKGTSYMISKGAGRNTISDAFMGPEPGATFARFHGHVFKKKDGGNGREIVRLDGPSPLHVFIEAGLDVLAKKRAGETMQHRLERRINFLILKAEGEI